MPLKQIYNYDFSQMSNPEILREKFFSRSLSISELKLIHDYLQNNHIELAGKTIPAAIYLKSSVASNELPFAIIAQLHGNEPSGLAGIALAMALFEAGLLKRDVIGIIGNPLAASQYFSAWEKNPSSFQETRDAFRCGVDEKGNLLADGNRIPVDFLEKDSGYPHIKRARELYHIAQNISGILDIHSARGNMTCITDHKNDGDLKYSPIRSVLADLAEAISANASKTVAVKTLKNTISHLPNIVSQTGIEAGRHEDPKSPFTAAAFTLSIFYNQKVADVKPLLDYDDGIFVRYSVKPRITYADLSADGYIQEKTDVIYMARETGGKVEEYQYDEMQAIKKGQVVAMAKPSGALLRADFDFSGIFFSKSSALYDKDPSVDPWPLAAEKMSSVKFCYPCIVSEIKMDFS